MQKLVEKLGFSESMASAVLWVSLSLLLLVVVVMLALWLVRTLRPSLNINGGARGGRPQRLAVTDAFPLDRDGRKLVIVRRDNTEHLLLIGGPNDLLVESNITRHDRAARGLPRAGESEGEDTAPAIPAPMQAPVPAPQVSLPANFVQPPQPMAAPQAGLAAPRVDDFERALLAPKPVARPAPPVIAPAPAVATALAPSVAPQPVFAQPDFTPPAAPAPPPLPPQEVAREEVAVAAPPVLTLESLLPEAVPVPPEAPKVEPVAPPPAPAPAPRAPAMSEMARRLNEALQKPMSGTLRPPFNRSIPPAPPTAGASATPMPPVSPVAPPAPPAPAETVTKADMLPPPAEIPPKADMDLLEEEMARLLGRPAQSKKPDAS